jgi:ATP-binding cassette, subfamily B, bacterial MsbA
MGIVTQETILFHDTIRNNIAYGLENPDPSDIRKAAAVANASEFIDVLPRGYDTIIGDRGARLSGGQRQRICIARAILRNPDILIFDEATSALDNESEAKVQSAIDHLIENRTAIVIAHRLSTIKRANKIIVIDGGEIREKGTHEELMQINGIYKRLYELQFRDAK